MNFLKETIRHPKDVGAVAPSSENLSNLILKEAQLKPGQTIVELGPGTGAFTNRILNSISADSQYVGLEINESFAEHLQRIYPDANIHQDSARNINNYVTKCDRIISGLPWTAFKKKKQTDLLQQLHGTLVEDGLFLTFAYPPFHYLPRGQAFQAALGETFSSVKKTATVLNLPPAFVYVCRK